MENAATSRLTLPRLVKIELKHFSLFRANPDAEIICDKNVICLVGANGIGKSTLLQAINFGLTGIVSEPNRTFKTIEDFYNNCKPYSKTYFRGRIDGSEEEFSEIHMTFDLGEKRYRIVRGLFEPEELRKFTISRATDNDIIVQSDPLSRTDRNKLFCDKFVEDSGFVSFEEFAFLQHFVFTFDEQRRILFWNQRVLERVLYKAFGFDPTMAKTVDNLRREISAADSRVRNIQWDVTKEKRRFNDLRSAATKVTGNRTKLEDLEAQRETLIEAASEKAAIHARTSEAIKDLDLQLSSLALRETTLRIEYDRCFQKSITQMHSIKDHPIVKRYETEHKCPICGIDDENKIKKIDEMIQQNCCPLCDNKIEPIDTPSQELGILQNLDIELKEIRKQKTSATILMKKSKEEQESQWIELKSAQKNLDEFNLESQTEINTLRLKVDNALDAEHLSSLTVRLAKLEQEKDDAYNEHKTLTNQLKGLQRKLEEQYVEVEKGFVKNFEELAYKFLGMPLSIHLEANQNSGDINLVVMVRASTRRQPEHLSESQRFFLDIALRMALIRHMSAPDGLGGIYIDTPEGALDIAYEKRAGDMLSIFAGNSHMVLMTANLNSSQLLISLARNCKRQGLKIIRMMDWSELSEVQRQESGLFDDAYANIESELGE